VLMSDAVGPSIRGAGALRLVGGERTCDHGDPPSFCYPFSSTDMTPSISSLVLPCFPRAISAIDGAFFLADASLYVVREIHGQFDESGHRSSLIKGLTRYAFCLLGSWLRVQTS
jgi:hypothetical protein